MMMKEDMWTKQRSGHKHVISGDDDGESSRGGEAKLTQKQTKKRAKKK